jgi:hypothetical protein
VPSTTSGFNCRCQLGAAHSNCTTYARSPEPTRTDPFQRVATAKNDFRSTRKHNKIQALTSN